LPAHRLMTPNALLTARPRDGAARTEDTLSQRLARPSRKP
jgi:hypothetical protein